MAQKTKTEAKTKKESKTTLKASLISPRMTEKAVLAQESKGVYTFNVEKDATKRSIFLSIKEKYKVTPRMVRVASIPSKKKFFRGKWGVRGGGKKAYVYLKKGDKIDVA